MKVRVKKMRMRFANAVLAACASLAVGGVGAQDFQPHPSHAPPPPPPTAPPPPAAPKTPPPKVLKMEPPEYPDRARRFNAESTLRTSIHVKANGSVESVEVLNGNPVFVDAVKHAIAKWKFEKRPEPSVVRLAFPFKITDDGEKSDDTAIRPLKSAPKAAADVDKPLIVGFDYVRVIIDASGKVKDRFHLSGEPDGFETSADLIIDKLEFEPLGEGDPPQPNGTINLLLIDYASDGVIRIQQRNGEPQRY